MNEYWPMDEQYIEKIMRRKNVFMREFSVAGVSKHQNLIPKNGFLNDDFFLPDILLEEKGSVNTVFQNTALKTSI